VAKIYVTFSWVC